MAVEASKGRWTLVREDGNAPVVSVPRNGSALVELDSAGSIISLITSSQPSEAKEDLEEKNEGLRLEALRQEENAARASELIRSAIEDTLTLFSSPQASDAPRWRREERKAPPPSERSAERSSCGSEDNASSSGRASPKGPFYNVLVWFENESPLPTSMLHRLVLDGRFRFHSVHRSAEFPPEEDNDNQHDVKGCIVRFDSLREAERALAEIDGASLCGLLLCAEPLFSLRQ